MEQNIKKWRTRSGLNFAMDEDLYYSVIENEQTLDRMETHIMAGEFFPQVTRFIGTLILLFNGKFDFISILLTNVCIEIVCRFLWVALPLYRIPGFSVLLTVIGQTVFRFFLHFITIIVLSLTIFDNWKIILFYIIVSVIVLIAGSLVFGYLFSVKRNNDIAKHVTK